MLYLYDNAIASDLMKSFNPDNVANPVVRVVDPEGIIDLAAQIQEDKIEFPIVAINRLPDIQIDQQRYNFTKAHKGIQSVIDSKTNELYYEKSIPIILKYDLTLLTTNGTDMDELVREILFKYTSMFFLTITLPYECNRKVRFGIAVDPDTNIEKKSGRVDYMKSGQIHQTIIHLRCEGCVLVSYTAAKLRRLDHVIELE